MSHKSQPVFVDIHAHLLYGLDDGARTLSESVEIAKLAAGDDVGYITCTPHMSAGRLIERERIIERVEEVRRAIKAARIGVKIWPGAEYRMFPELADLAQKRRLVTVGKSERHVLVELPWTEIPIYAQDLFFKLQLVGYTPVLAHPERNEAIQAKPQVVQQFVDRGCLIQITNSSLVGEEGPAARKTAQYLISSNLAHVMASDAHRPGHRSFHFKRAYEILVATVGEQRANRMVHSVPEEITGGLIVD